ncbi:hypothetical protein AB0J43_02715 [Nonomuraea fuscirosea]
MTISTDIIDITPDMIRPRAQAVLRRDGWTQYKYIRLASDAPIEQAPCCMVEAIGRAAGLPPFALSSKTPPVGVSPARWEVARNTADEVALDLGRDPSDDDQFSPVTYLSAWNDTKGRTLAQVLDALEPPTSKAGGAA